MSFKKLDPQDISISAESVVAPAWSEQITTLNSFYTSSDQTSTNSGLYYYNIYQTTAGSSNAAIQFAAAYGNRKGSGSQWLTATEPGKSPSSIVYGQYRTLVNGDENTDFTFGTVTPDSIFVLAVNRSRYKEKLLPGTFNITLGSGSARLQLTDNSKTSTTVSYVDSGRVYDIVSGSNGIPYSGTGFTATSGSYGKFLPDVGLILLNGEALKAPTGLNGGLGMVINESSDVDGENLKLIYNSLNLFPTFSLQSEETISSNYVFVRVRNNEYNYSTNPSNISGSGELRHNIMINTPQAYITTVGLYNDNNDLLGVAKLSKPLLKDFTKEALIRIKLDY